LIVFDSTGVAFNAVHDIWCFAGDPGKYYERIFGGCWLHMSLCIAADSIDANSKVSEFFARSKYFFFIDPATEEYDIRQNRAMYSGGAGPIAVGQVLRHKPSAIIAGRIGSKAVRALRKSGVAVFEVKNITVGEALGLYKSGELQAIKAERNRTGKE
jgi:predicted Fe-Mo cluster-binding NifX family protein